MKDLIIRTLTTIAAAFVLAMGANAQTAQQYRAEVPFDFTANGKQYSAGNYSVGPVTSNSNSGATGILNRDNGHMRILGNALPGQDNWRESPRLIFKNIDGTYVLSQIVTPTFEMKVRGAESDARLAKRSGEAPKYVAVRLH